MNTLSINGTALPNVYVDASLSYNKPIKDLETFRVPGRNGALIIDNGTWDNVVITYPCYTKTLAAFENIVETLGALKGYQKIACSNDSTHYRMGVPIIPQAPTARRINTNFYFNLSFNCKPQRFLTSGDTAITLSGQQMSLSNPTNFESRPTVHLVGNGYIVINGTKITVSNNASPNYIDVDCELMTCTQGTTDRSSDVAFSSNDFPTIPSGSSTAQIVGVTGSITPKWWEL